MSRQAVSDFVRTTCGGAGVVAGNNAKLRPGISTFPNTLLVIGVGDRVDEILASEVAYRGNFPHILYCGSAPIDSSLKSNLLKWRVSYTSLGSVYDPVNCVRRAFDVHFNVAGVLFVPDTALILPRALAQKYQHMLWMTADILMDVPNKVWLCEQQTVGCRGVSREVINTLAQQLVGADISDTRFVANVRNCFKKVVAEPTLQQRDVYHLTDIVFHIPAKLRDTFTLLTNIYGTSSKHRDAYSHIVLLLLECLEMTTEYTYYSSVDAREKADKLDYLFPFLFSDVARNKPGSYKDYFCPRLAGVS